MRGVETIDIYRKLESIDSMDDADEAGAVFHHQETGCIPWPRTSTDLYKGEVIIDGQDIFIPAPVVGVLETDEVEFRGRRYEIEGVPGDYRLRGRQRGVLLVLKRLGSS